MGLRAPSAYSLHDKEAGESEGARLKQELETLSAGPGQTVKPQPWLQLEFPLSSHP